MDPLLGDHLAEGADSSPCEYTLESGLPIKIVGEEPGGLGMQRSGSSMEQWAGVIPPIQEQVAVASEAEASLRRLQAGPTSPTTDRRSRNGHRRNFTPSGLQTQVISERGESDTSDMAAPSNLPAGMSLQDPVNSPSNGSGGVGANPTPHVGTPQITITAHTEITAEAQKSGVAKIHSSFSVQGDGAMGECSYSDSTTEDLLLPANPARFQSDDISHPDSGWGAQEIHSKASKIGIENESKFKEHLNVLENLHKKATQEESEAREEYVSTTYKFRCAEASFLEAERKLKLQKTKMEGSLKVLEPTMSQKTTPRELPTELVEKIIETLWLSAFSNTDRIKFMTASVLISKAWTHLYSRVSSRDTVIPSVKYAKYFHTHLLDESSVIFNKSTHNMPNEHCRSLRFDVESPSVQTPSHLNSKFVHSFDNSESVFDLLDWLADIPYLPLLRRISIEFHNCGFTDLFDNMRLVIFPPQVTDLDISFSFAEGTSPKRIRDLQKDMPLRIPEGLPLNHIQRLGIFGGGVSPVLGLLVTSCTSLRAVRTDLIDRSTVEEEKDYLKALREVCNDRCMSLELC
ncbi:hypothetical protein EYR40_008042 [Pleurotus pulmonarius]|nr:hypothetical protein EYR40_008042 [Pleurotus pulmonarius]